MVETSRFNPAGFSRRRYGAGPFMAARRGLPAATSHLSRWSGRKVLLFSCGPMSLSGGSMLLKWGSLLLAWGLSRFPAPLGDESPS